MLTAIRKIHKQALIVVTFVICVAFAYLYSKYDAGLADGAGPGDAVTVWGRSYRGSEALKIANQFSLAMTELGFRPPFSVTPIGSFAQQLHFMGQADFSQDRTNYVVNLLTLRGAARRLGVEASPEGVTKALEEVDLFQDPATGRFSPALMERFIQERMGSRSLGEIELRELVGDFVAYEKVRELVGSGFEPTSWEVDRDYRRRFEELTIYEVFLKEDGKEAAPVITGEDIAAFYEENPNSFLTPERRRIGYFRFPLPERAEDEAEDQWKAKRIEEAKAFNRVYKSMGEALESGAGIEKALSLVEGREAQEASPFPLANPPEELAGEADLLRRVFALSPQEENALGASETEKAIYLFWLKEAIPPAPMTLEEARDEIQARLTAQRLDQQINERADQAREALAEELKKGGRTFPEAAAAAGLAAKRLRPFTRMATPEDSDFASTVSALAEEMVPGQLSEPRILGDGALLIFLAQAELPPRETEPEDRKRIADMLRFQGVNQAFTAWFDAQTQAASPVLPTMKLADGEVETLSIERFGRR